MRVLPCGTAALLVELASGDEAAQWHVGAEAARLAGVEELVPGARTVLVRFDTVRTDSRAQPAPPAPWVAVVLYRYST